MNKPINISLFEPIIKYITSINATSGGIEIKVPSNIAIDFDTVKSYFDESTTLNFETGNPFIFLKGRFRDLELAKTVTSLYISYNTKKP